VGRDEQLATGRIMVPDQISDYTLGRERTFHDGDGLQEGLIKGVDHIDFTWLYDQVWRQSVLDATVTLQIDCFKGGTYGCMQGPRLETAAEIKKLQRDGCDAVGMTSMPEAALAREAGLRYASLGVVVNWAAGLSDEPITLETIMQVLQASMVDVKGIIVELSKGF